MDRGYNIHESPIGNTQVTVDPTLEDTPVYSERQFCTSQYNGTDKWPFPSETYPCQAWDPLLMTYPNNEPNSLFITTKVDIVSESYMCGQGNTPGTPTAEDGCDAMYAKTQDPVSYFLVNEEHISVNLLHSYIAPKFASHHSKNSHFRGSSSTLFGRLIDQDGDVDQDFFISPTPRPDKVSSQDLLLTAGVNLSAAVTVNGTTSSYRAVGAVVLVDVHFTNEDGKVKYTITSTQLPNAVYNVAEVRWAAGGTDLKVSRTIITRHGVKFHFVVTGDLEVFDFQTLLIQIASSVVLFFIANVLIEFCMMNVIAGRDYYRKMKYEDVNRQAAQMDEIGLSDNLNVNP